MVGAVSADGVGANSARRFGRGRLVVNGVVPAGEVVASGQMEWRGVDAGESGVWAVVFAAAGFADAESDVGASGKNRRCDASGVIGRIGGGGISSSGI